MLLRIDPRLTVLWRSLDTVQFGAPYPVASVRVDGDWELHVLELLRLGVDSARLQRLAARQRDPSAEARLDVVLASVERALDSRYRREPAPVAVALHAPDDLRDPLARALHGLGLRTSGPARVQLIAAHFFVRPSEYQSFLSSDLPHLPLIGFDTEIWVGPLIEPGATGCLHCVELHRRDADPSWPTLAAQLLRRRSPAMHSVLLAAAAIDAACMVSSWAESRQPAQEITIVRFGSRQRISVTPHPECGCLLPEGNVTVLADRADPDSPSSRRVSAALG